VAGGRKTESRELAAARLAVGGTIAEAAAAGGVGERVIYLWKKEAAFKARVRELRSEAVGRAVGLLSDAMTEAATTLRDLLASEAEPIRLRAAVALLELGLKGADAEDIRRQLDELEAALRGKGKAR
jgi:hypothetical protein